MVDSVCSSNPHQHCFPQLGEDHCEVGGGDEERLLRFHHRPLRVLLLLPRRLRHASLVPGGVMLPLLLPHALLLHLGEIGKQFEIKYGEYGTRFCGFIIDLLLRNEVK
jgi:hypothetical protein